MIYLKENSTLQKVLVQPHRIVFFEDSVCFNVEISSQVHLYRANSLMDPWMKRYLKHRTQPRFRVPQSIRDFFLGIKDKFPLCCILHFCWDTLWNKQVRTTRRETKYTKNGTPYIPCFYHSSNRRTNKK